MWASMASLVLALAAPLPTPCAVARAEYEGLSLDAALDHAELGLEQDPTRPLECLEVKGLALLVLGRTEEAMAVLAEIFRRDPDHSIVEPSLSPAQLDSIALAQRRAIPPAPGPGIETVQTAPVSPVSPMPAGARETGSNDLGSWPVWVLIGLGIVGAGVGVGLLLRPRLPDASGTLGRVDVSR